MAQALILKRPLDPIIIKRQRRSGRTLQSTLDHQKRQSRRERRMSGKPQKVHRRRKKRQSERNEKYQTAARIRQRNIWLFRQGVPQEGRSIQRQTERKRDIAYRTSPM